METERNLCISIEQHFIGILPMFCNFVACERALKHFVRFPLQGLCCLQPLYTLQFKTFETLYLSLPRCSLTLFP